jgi:hypothetical protein
MTNTYKNKDRKNKMFSNIEAAAMNAASHLRGWDTVSQVSFMAVSSIINKLNITNTHENKIPKDKERLFDFPISAGYDIAKIAQINPVIMKPTLERIALLSLSDIFDKNKILNKENIDLHFEKFSKAIQHANQAGPISKKTLSKIRDFAGSNMQSISLIHLALDSKLNDKVGIIKILLDAGLNPEFKIKQTDQAPIEMYATKNDNILMNLLSKKITNGDQIISATDLLLRAWESRSVLDNLTRDKKHKNKL